MSRLAFHRTTGEGFAAGALADASLASGGGGLTLTGVTIGSWTGPWQEPGFDVHEVIASWNADTPHESLIEVELQAVTADRIETEWYALGSWTYGDSSFGRTSIPGQRDAFGRVETDTFCAELPLRAYRLRLKLHAGDSGAPTVRLLAAVAASRERREPMASEPGIEGIELQVPPFSQSIHAGEYPQYGGGGTSWCSPTSTAMVLAYWGAGPEPADVAWVDPSFADPWVDHAARHTFDTAYAGTGNWSFNTAYAAHFGLDAFVTRLRSLREAEQFLNAGIPLVASIAAGPGELSGFPVPQGTAGHLVVIVGCTASGDPIVNDPAAPSNDAVRRVYDRAQFEQVWVGGSGGVVFVISEPGVTLPPSRGNW